MASDGADDGEPPSVAPPSPNALVAAVQNAIEWGFRNAIDGLPGEPTVCELTAQYRREYGDDIEAAITNFVRWQIAKAGTAGFVSNVGGLALLPVSLPANVVGVIFLHLRMIAAIACMRGYDPTDERVRTLALTCLAGDAAYDVLKDAGIAVGTKLSMKAVEQISGAVVTQINQAVGFRLVTKFGSTGIVNLGKMIPFVGGVLGGTFDAVATQLVANVARRVFPPLDAPLSPRAPSLAPSSMTDLGDTANNLLVCGES